MKLINEDIARNLLLLSFGKGIELSDRKPAILHTIVTCLSIFGNNPLSEKSGQLSTTPEPGETPASRRETMSRRERSGPRRTRSGFNICCSHYSASESEQGRDAGRTLRDLIGRPLVLVAVSKRVSAIKDAHA